MNRVVYLAVAVLVGTGLWFSRNRLGWAGQVPDLSWQKTRRRFSRWLPACFAMLAMLILVSGAIYPPSTHTAMTYRTPRVLNWLSEGHWIHTPDYRMNNRACRFEWLTAPLLLFTGSDRSLFLINFVSFLLLSGFRFSVRTRLGVRPRVAWWWMWLLPTGYNFLLQAGSVSKTPSRWSMRCPQWTSRCAARPRAGFPTCGIPREQLHCMADCGLGVLLLPFSGAGASYRGPFRLLPDADVPMQS